MIILSASDLIILAIRSSIHHPIHLPFDPALNSIVDNSI